MLTHKCSGKIIIIKVKYYVSREKIDFFVEFFTEISKVEPFEMAIEFLNKSEKEGIKYYFIN
jgi:hypothetical protein